MNDIIELAVAEDTGHGDITSEILIPAQLLARASILAKERGVLAGGEVARDVFLKVDPSLKVELLIEDGASIKPGDVIATVSGRVNGILKAERVALNFLQRLSGIASQTAQFVDRTRGSSARITDTRKTTPGIRTLEKYAVRMGGGYNHRSHLADDILIKDNHLTALRSLGMSLKDIVITAKQKSPPDLDVEVEVTTVEEAVEAAEAGSDIIMLDNMKPEEMRRAVDLIAGRARVEASGGITLANVHEVATTGVDIISIGALTHSSTALDINLEIEPESLKMP